jgi:hypothetical protein
VNLLSLYRVKSRVTVVGTVTTKTGIVVQSLDEAKDLPLVQGVQNGSGALLAFTSTSNADVFPGVKWPWNETDHSDHLLSKPRKSTSIPPLLNMSLRKVQDNFYVYFYRTDSLGKTNAD